MKPISAIECLEKSVQSLAESLCELAISHCKTSSKLIQNSSLPDGPERQTLLNGLNQMETNASNALLAFRQIAESAGPEPSESWLQRLIKRNRPMPA